MESFKPQLEICAETPQACLAAMEGGAHRIEICSALNDGGVTPSHGFIRQAICSARGLPVYVLLRPRRGNFFYSSAEFDIIRADLDHALELGAAGVVTGILTEQGTVDDRRMRDLVQRAAGKQVTFHRAFDRTPNLSQSLEEIINTGCGRLLTSGGQPSVREGLRTIVELTQQAQGRIRIAAGGGLTAKLACELLRLADADFHVSLRNKGHRALDSDPLWTDENDIFPISADKVRAMASILGGGGLR